MDAGLYSRAPQLAVGANDRRLGLFDHRSSGQPDLATYERAALGFRRFQIYEVQDLSERS